MIKGINKFFTFTCECKCKFHRRECNSNQKWNNNKCWCKCKNPKKHHACEKDYFGILLQGAVKMVNIEQLILTIQ